MKKTLTVLSLSLFLASAGSASAYTMPIECPVPFTQADRDILYSQVKDLDAKVRDGARKADDAIALLRSGNFDFKGNDKAYLDGIEASWQEKIDAQQKSMQSVIARTELQGERWGMNVSDPANFAKAVQATANDEQKKVDAVANARNLALSTARNNLSDQKIQQFEGEKESMLADIDPGMTRLIETVKCPLTDTPKTVAKKAVSPSPAPSQAVARPAPQEIAPAVPAETEATSLPDVPVRRTVWVRMGSLLRILRFW